MDVVGPSKGRPRQCNKCAATHAFSPLAPASEYVKARAFNNNKGGGGQETVFAPRSKGAYRAARHPATSAITLIDRSIDARAKQRRRRHFCRASADRMIQSRFNRERRNLVTRDTQTERGAASSSSSQRKKHVVVVRCVSFSHLAPSSLSSLPPLWAAACSVHPAHHRHLHAVL